ncbi:acyl-CoA thioester hydrolase YfbB [Shigella flexneri]|nr:2-succinyl-6-hydroxy-2,4-cyclohexadiene-1-carboxylate synthase [Shigella flexneri]SRP06437.1 acyl-CoA thioester hydrolase YfbB [Shigella flexneri]
MILHAQAKHGKLGLPWLVFLHGFSGDCHEWQEVGEAFADYSRLYVDLLGHGGSAAISVDGFDDVTDLLRKTLVSYNILDFWLVGYSLGGRVAMMAACQGLAGLCGVIVEGGHPGLQNAEQRAERQRSDRQWAQRFRTEPLTAVFADWYQQPVFASLNDDQRRELVALRSNNNGATLAAMLEATSMAQPLPPCWRRLLSPSSLIYVLTLAPAHLRFIIYVVNVTANSAPWRRNWLPTAMSFLAPDITRIGKIPLA